MRKLYTLYALESLLLSLLFFTKWIWISYYQCEKAVNWMNLLVADSLSVCYDFAVICSLYVSVCLPLPLLGCFTPCLALLCILRKVVCDPHSLLVICRNNDWLKRICIQYCILFFKKYITKIENKDDYLFWRTWHDV